MPISKLIEKLEAIKKEYGDLEVYIWDTYDGGRKVIENSVSITYIHNLII